jgi:hypothetical protein
MLVIPFVNLRSRLIAIGLGGSTYQGFDELAGRHRSVRPLPIRPQRAAESIQHLSAGNTMLIIDEQPIAPAPLLHGAAHAQSRVVQCGLVGGFRAGFPVLQICTGPRFS